MDVYAIVPVVLAIGCYYNSLAGQLVFDDVAAIRDNPDLRPETSWLDIFFHDFWGKPLIQEDSHKSYRPLTVSTYRLNYLVHGLDAFGYHLVNVVAHVSVCWLYGRICLLFLSPKTSFVASVLFAVHPIHTEAVASVVGRAELLSACFYLLTLWLYVAKKGPVSWLGIFSLSILGFLCKEQSVTVLMVCAVHELCSIQIWSFRNCWSSVRPSAFRLAWIFLVTGILIWVRFSFMGGSLPKFSRFDNPASVSPSPYRHLTYLYLSVLNFGLLLYPWPLCCDWSMGTVPVVDSFLDLRNLVTLCFYAGCLLWLRTSWRKTAVKRSLLMGLAMTVVPYIPSSNLFFPVGFVVAERTLYLPSMGYCILVATGWTHILKLGRYDKSWLRWGLWLLILSHVVRTVRRNEDWRTEYALYQSALKITPKNAKMYNNMGRVLEGEGKHAHAIHYFKSAIRIEPEDVRGYLNLGRITADLGNYSEAENIYLQAKSVLDRQLDGKDTTVTPSHLQVLVHLASIVSVNRSRLPEADRLYQQLIELKSDYSPAYLGRGNLLSLMNRTDEAEAMYRRALSLDPHNPDIFSNLAAVLRRMGRKGEAVGLLNKALLIQPHHQEALMNSALLLEDDTSQRHLSGHRTEEILAATKENGEVLFQLGMMFLSEKNSKSAEIWLKKAVQSQPSMKSALFNLALLLSEEDRPAESFVYVKQLLQFHPDHIKGLILLADIYVNSLEDLDSAEQCYARVLRLEPDNLQSLHNTCVIHLKRTQYRKAADCFYNVSNLYPSVDYVQRNLRLTRQLLSDPVSANSPKQ